MDTKELLTTLRSIDTSLRLLAASKSTTRTTGFVDKRQLSEYMGVKPVTVDKLIHQGIVSKGSSGLVEGRHYCKLDPSETNTANFLFDPTRVMADAWTSFTNYGDSNGTL